MKKNGITMVYIVNLKSLLLSTFIENGSPAFDEFLELIGERVKMKGFTKYRAQLDNKTDTTGEYSIFTEFENSEIMFHVSTLLPFTPVNKQQVVAIMY
jgi:hypothetical protein